MTPDRPRHARRPQPASGAGARAALATLVTTAAVWFGAWGALVLLAVPPDAAVVLGAAVPVGMLLAGRREARRATAVPHRRRAPAAR